MKYEYFVFYRDAEQKRLRIGILSLVDSEHFTFKYLTSSTDVKFPGLRNKQSSGHIELLWNRVPANIRNESTSKRRAFDRFVNYFQGRVVTDRFEFEPRLK